MPGRQLHRFAVDFFAGDFCASALPAADLLAALVRPSVSTFEAADAAVLEVSFFGAFVCDNADPAAFFDALPVDSLVKVFEAFDAAFLPVTLLFAIQISPKRSLDALALGITAGC